MNIFNCLVIGSRATPYIIKPDEVNLSVKVGFVFFRLGLVTSVLLYLYIPEKKGLNFDEIDYHFLFNVSPDKFASVIKEYRDRGETIPCTLKGSDTVLAVDKNGAIAVQQE